MSPPLMFARRKPTGEWYIEINWPNGRREEAGNFASAAFAEKEIAERMQAWHEGQARYRDR